MLALALSPTQMGHRISYLMYIHRFQTYIAIDILLKSQDFHGFHRFTPYKPYWFSIPKPCIETLNHINSPYSFTMLIFHLPLNITGQLGWLFPIEWKNKQVMFQSPPTRSLNIIQPGHATRGSRNSTAVGSPALSTSSSTRRPSARPRGTSSAPVSVGSEMRPRQPTAVRGFSR